MYSWRSSLDLWNIESSDLSRDQSAQCGQKSDGDDWFFDYINPLSDNSAIIADMDSKLAVFTLAVASLAWLLLIHPKFTEAQVTFSRDWNAGKRSMSSIECALPLRSATTVCQMLVNELRAITSCEMKSLLSSSNENNAEAFGVRAG